MFFPLKQKVNFPLPLNVLIFVPGDFRDAFCVAGVTLDATGEMSLWDIPEGHFKRLVHSTTPVSGQ